MKTRSRSPHGSFRLRRMPALRLRVAGAVTLLFMLVATALAGSAPACCAPRVQVVQQQEKHSCCKHETSVPDSTLRVVASQPSRGGMPPCCDHGVCCKATSSHAVPHQTTSTVHQNEAAAAPVSPHDSWIPSAPSDTWVAPGSGSSPPRSRLRVHLLNCAILC